MDIPSAISLSLDAEKYSVDELPAAACSVSPSDAADPQVSICTANVQSWSGGLEFGSDKGRRLFGVGYYADLLSEMGVKMVMALDPVDYEVRGRLASERARGDACRGWFEDGRGARTVVKKRSYPDLRAFWDT